MMSRDEIIDCARNISDFLRMGESIEDTCFHLTKIQPKYTQKWKAIARDSSQGVSFGQLLRKYDMWPDEMCEAVIAGEKSGNLEDILESVMDFQKELVTVASVIKQKVYFPMAFIFGGIGIFIAFMIGVLPGVSKSIKEEEDRVGLVAVSDWFVYVKENELDTVLVLTILVLLLIVGLAKNDKFRRQFMMTLDGFPSLGHGIRSIYFGLWAKFMVILDQSGSIPIAQMINISSQVLPDFYRNGTDLLEKEIQSQQGAVWATDHTRWKRSDPRSNWPVRLKISLASAAGTGNIEGSLGRASGPLLRDGVQTVSSTLTVFDLIAKAVAAAAILAPLVGMMLVQLQVVNTMK